MSTFLGDMRIRQIHTQNSKPCTMSLMIRLGVFEWNSISWGAKKEESNAS